MKCVAVALIHLALAQTEEDTTDWRQSPVSRFLDGKCRELGATPGNTGCDGVVQATDGSTGLVCEDDGHLGDSERHHCDRNAELSVVLSTAQTLLDQVAGADPTAFMSLETLMNDYCNLATAGDDEPCQEAREQTDGAWKCIKMGGYCESITDELLTVKWTHEFAVAGRHQVIHCPGGPGEVGDCGERPMPYCDPPKKRFFNSGGCFDTCPDYHDEVNINGEDVCLPTLTREAGRLEESTLQAMNSGVGNVTLRITYPLLPMNFSEVVNTEFVVDVAPQRDDLNREDKDDECNLVWRRDIRNSTSHTINGEGDANDRHKIPFGVDREAFEFTSTDEVIQEFTGFPATKKARLTVSLLFKGALDNHWQHGNMDDAIALSVSMDGATWTRRETTWPALGKSHAVLPEDRKIKRQHVCQWGKGEADVPFEHCEGFFYFDIEEDVDFTNLKVKLEGIEGISSAAFEWAFAEMQVELPFIVTTLSYSDFNGACRLDRAVEAGEHLERRGWVSLALIATWADTAGTMMRELQHHVVWPFTARFPTMVGASYLPWNMWETYVGEEVNAEALPWPSLLDLSEDATFDIIKRVPRYEVGSIVYARQCMDPEYDTADLKLEFRTLCLSNDDDPNAPEAFERVLTADVTVLDSFDEGRCVYISFSHDQTCEWCTLHMWSIVTPITITESLDADAVSADVDADATLPGNRRLTKQNGRRRRQARSLSGHTEKEEVQSQPSEREGWARSSLTGFEFEGAESDSGASRPVTMSLALALATPAWFLVQ
jgi:hypothetical protein